MQHSENPTWWYLHQLCLLWPMGNFKESLRWREGFWGTSNLNSEGPKGPEVGDSKISWDFPHPFFFLGGGLYWCTTLYHYFRYVTSIISTSSSKEKRGAGYDSITPWPSLHHVNQFPIPALTCLGAKGRTSSMMRKPPKQMMLSWTVTWAPISMNFPRCLT